MNKNFLILFIITGIIGISFKIYFSTVEIPENDLSQNYNKKYSITQIDSIFNLSQFFTNKFKEISSYDLHKMENILSKDIVYESKSYEFYANANIYFKRYSEFLSAGDLLSELNKNLYIQPRTNIFGEFKIPITKSLDSETKEKYNIYLDELSEGYGNSILEQSENHMPNTINIDNSIIYNPTYYYNSAEEYKGKAIFNYKKFLLSSDLNQYNEIIASVRLGLLYFYSKKHALFSSLFNEKIKDVKIILDYLNNDEDNFYLVKIDLINYLVALEKQGIITFSDSKKIFKGISWEFKENVQLLYSIKRELYDLPEYEYILDNIKCADYDLLFGPEIAVNKSELLFKNYYNDESLLESEEQINYFWSGQCTDSKGMWFYSNYAEVLLRSCRLALWNGGKISFWYGNFRDQYIAESQNEISDNRFINLRDVFSSYVIAITNEAGTIKPKDN